MSVRVFGETRREARAVGGGGGGRRVIVVAFIFRDTTRLFHLKRQEVLSLSPTL